MLDSLLGRALQGHGVADDGGAIERPSRPGCGTALLGPPHGRVDTLLDRFVRAEHAEGRLAGMPLAVAYSGGTDSTALLLGLLRALARLPGRQRPTAVLAFHVDHGLQPAALHFIGHTATVCEALAGQAPLPLQWVCEAVSVPRPRGASIEQRAREARYRALAAMARRHGARQVLLGHHADDQAESILLALSRGAGLPGLAGMPARFERHGMAFARPLLTLGRQRIAAWLQGFDVPAVEDPSNADPRHTRNRLRLQALPLLRALLPGFDAAAARSARHAAEAQALLDELARGDWSRLSAALEPQGRLGAALPTPGGSLRRLPLAEFTRLLPRLHWANALRWWLRTAHDGAAASSAQIEALCAQIETAARHGAPRRLRLRVAAGCVRRDGGWLDYLADPVAASASQDPSRIEGLP